MSDSSHLLLTHSVASDSRFCQRNSHYSINRIKSIECPSQKAISRSPKGERARPHHTYFLCPLLRPSPTLNINRPFFNPEWEMIRTDDFLCVRVCAVLRIYIDSQLFIDVGTRSQKNLIKSGLDGYQPYRIRRQPA